jgi:hypothetical protein
MASCSRRAALHCSPALLYAVVGRYVCRFSHADEVWTVTEATGEMDSVDRVCVTIAADTDADSTPVACAQVTWDSQNAVLEFVKPRMLNICDRYRVEWRHDQPRVTMLTSGVATAEYAFLSFLDRQ